jgi:DNA-binding NarL/FixJ family response regulator
VTKPECAMERELTDRELEIAEMVAAGLTREEIALATGLSVHTIRTHLQNIYQKLSIHSNVQLTNWVRDGASGHSRSPNG